MKQEAGAYTAVATDPLPAKLEEAKSCEWSNPSPVPITRLRGTTESHP